MIKWTPLVLSVAMAVGPRLAAQTATASADSVSTAPTAHTTRVDQPIEVDGRLNEPAWSSAPVISNFIQHEPVEGEPVTEPTEVRILYDDQALYVGGWMYDSRPYEVVVTQARRDASLENTDALLIVLDTYLDRQNGFVFGTTPSGIEYDGQVTKEGEGGFGGGQQRQQRGSGGGFNLNWDGSWEVATSVDSAGWYAELRIPFTTLRYGGGGEQVWGMNIARNIRRRNEQSFWAPVPRQFTFYRVSLAGTLEGLEAPARGTVSITPYALSSAHKNFALDADTDLRAAVGGDAKIGITPSLTLDLTLNTDFAQVEVDEQQINLTRFSLFFPEKRPFFLENAGTFSVGTPQAVELFFSRRIGIGDGGEEVPLVGGARLSGKVGGLTLGVLAIQADAVDEQNIGPDNFGVVRPMWELPNRSRIGGIFVSRVNTRFSNDYNFTYGLDGRLGIGETITIDAYAAKTETPGLFGRDYTFSVSGSYTTPTWEAGAAFRAVGEDFNPEVGFVPRDGYRFINLRVLRHIRFPSVSWFRELRPHISLRQHANFDGFIETRVVHIDNHFEFSNGAFFQFPSVNLTREGLEEPFEIAPGVIIPPGTYDNVNLGYRFHTNESAALSLNGRIDLGGFYSGTRNGVSGTLTGRLGSTFSAGLRLAFDDVRLPEGNFQTSLIGLRVAYSFTPRIYLQSLVQYNDQTDEFATNVRFGWLSTAGTGLFIVFNDVETSATRWAPVDRALIVKFSRQFTLGG